MDYIKILTGITATIALIIGYHQVSIARAKLRLDLYNKRFNIFTNCVKLLHALEKVEHNMPVSENFDNVFRDFLISIHESRFLFDKDIQDALKVISNDAFKISRYKERCVEINNSLPPPSLVFDDENIKRQETLYRNIATLEDKMEKYLNFHTLDGVSNMKDCFNNLFYFRKND